MEKPEAYHQGFNDGGKSMTEASYAAFCVSMIDEGFAPADILRVLRRMDDTLLVYAGDSDLIQQAFNKSGILVDFSEVFSQDKFCLKEGIA